jgi:light-harvesting protein B-800-850 alpha chain
MNQGRIWCVVNPTVGLPLFLGAVAAISLIVHWTVLTYAPWMAAFFAGGAGG